MKDNRIPLAACGVSQITLEGECYVLETPEPLGRGGTCLVYRARTLEHGTGRRVLLKEFYPSHANCGSWRMPDGSLRIPAEDPLVRAKKDRFDKAFHLFLNCFNDPRMNQYTVQAQHYRSGNGTDYMVVDYSSGMTLEEYLAEKPCLFDFFSRAKRLAEGLERMHRFGYCHLDVKPGNLLCFREHDLVKLLDTDSFLQPEELRQRGVVLSTSMGYSAPEVYDLAELLSDRIRNHLKLRQFFQQRDPAVFGEKADLYGLGAILYEYIFGNPPDQPALSLAQCLGTPLTERLRAKERYLPGKAISRIRELLRRTLAENPEDRYETTAGAIAAIQALLPLVNPGEVRVLENFTPNPYPVLGRASQLAALEQLIGQQSGPSRVVLIKGPGGLGKTTLARYYGQKHREEYDIIAEVSASSAANALLRITILNWAPSKENPVADCQKVLADLSQKYRMLLIINNYDVSEDPGFGLWRQLGCDVILTSRHDWDQSMVPAIGLHCNDLMPTAQQEPSKEIFRYFYTLEAGTGEELQRLNHCLDQDGEALDQLLALMNHHPLGLKLLARHMALVPGQEMAPSQALQELTWKGLDRNPLKTFQNQMDTELVQANLYGHLSAIFRSALNSRQLAPGDRESLRLMTLVPPSGGISTHRFSVWTGLDPIHLERLRRQGWLEHLPRQQDPVDDQTHTGVYTMPTVIREVLRQEPDMECTVQNCATFVENSMIPFSEYYSVNYRFRNAYRDQQEFLIRSLTQQPDPAYIELLLSITSPQCMIDQSGEHLDLALFWLQTCLKLCQALENNDLLLSRCNASLASVYCLLDQEEQMRFHLKAGVQAIGQTDLKTLDLLDNSNMEWLSSWNFVLSVMSGHYDSSQSMLPIFCRLLLDAAAHPEDNIAVISIYLANAGKFLHEMGKLGMARIFFEESTYPLMATYWLGDPHSIPGLSYAYSMMGQLDLELGNYPQAKKALKLSLHFAQLAYNDEHMLVEQSRNDLRNACQDAVEFQAILADDHLIADILDSSGPRNHHYKMSNHVKLLCLYWKHQPIISPSFPKEANDAIKMLAKAMELFGSLFR